MGVAVLLGVILLGCALAYGMFQYYTRDRRNDRKADAATRAMYEEKEPPPRA